MDIIEGTVESIVFQSENKQFCVFRIRSAALGMVTAERCPGYGNGGLQGTGPFYGGNGAGFRQLDTACAIRPPVYAGRLPVG